MCVSLQVNESHSGRYTCTPMNNLGTEGPSPPMNVIVQRPPMFTIVPHNLYLRKPGETLEIPCDAVDGNDNHKPKIAWLRVSICPYTRAYLSVLSSVYCITVQKSVVYRSGQ